MFHCDLFNTKLVRSIVGSHAPQTLGYSVDLDHSIVRSIARPLDRSVGQSLDRWIAFAIAQSIGRSNARSLAQSLDRSVVKYAVHACPMFILHIRIVTIVLASTTIIIHACTRTLPHARSPAGRHARIMITKLT